MTYDAKKDDKGGKKGGQPMPPAPQPDKGAPDREGRQDKGGQKEQQPPDAGAAAARE